MVNPMKVTVMGAGSIGGYFGGMLARDGHDVTLIARGEHLEAIRSGGLQMHTEAGDFNVSCNATDNPAEVGPVDLALLTTKTYHNAVAVPSMAPMVGPDTAILCLQNGIDSYRPLLDAFPDATVLPGAAYIEASRPGPGAVRQSGPVVRIVTGPVRGAGPSHGQRAEEICAAFRAAGAPAEASDDIAVTPLDQVPVHRHHGRHHIAGERVHQRSAASTGMAEDHPRLHGGDRAGRSRLRRRFGPGHRAGYAALH